MNSDLVHFVSGSVLVEIIPEFDTELPLYFLSGEFGPFVANQPVKVPLWAAQVLAKTRFAHMVPPHWLTNEGLASILEEERSQSSYVPLPHENFWEISYVALSLIPTEQLPDGASLRHKLNEILLIRQKKTRFGMQDLEGSAPGFAFPGLSRFELICIRSFLTEGFHLFSRLSAAALGEAVSNDSQQQFKLNNTSFGVPEGFSDLSQFSDANSQVFPSLGFSDLDALSPQDKELLDFWTNADSGDPHHKRSRSGDD
ncbi:hypothetical protein P9112_012413 [Eukaryota sp. TZLM1-RC]